MTLRLASAGESHGPGLVAIVTGLPAGLELDRDAIDADLKRRQEGYGRSPRQQIEQDRVDVLAGLRQGKTIGTPLALVVWNKDHKNWTWGMNPWPPEGEPHGKGTKPVTLPRPGHADLPGVFKYDLDDVRNALERASARHTAVHVAVGGVAKALLATIGIEVEGTTVDEELLRERIDAARAERDTVGGIVEIRARGVMPGLGSYAVQGRPPRRAARRRRDGDPGREGRRDRRRLRARRRSSAPLPTMRSAPTSAVRPTMRAASRRVSRTARRSSIRAAMKPLPTLMKPLGSVDLATGEAAQALVERSDVAAVEALAVVAEVGRCVGARLRRAGQVRR